MASDRIEQIRDLLKSIETGDPEPVAVVNEAKYIQHNPQTHVSGVIDVLFDVDRDSTGLVVKSAGLLRTARKLMSGVVSIPGDIWK